MVKANKTNGAATIGILFPAKLNKKKAERIVGAEAQHLSAARGLVDPAGLYIGGAKVSALDMEQSGAVCHRRLAIRLS